MSKFEEEGRWDIHFFPCGGGCHHLTQVDLSDSRKGFQAHVEHIMHCIGGRGWNNTALLTREGATLRVKQITPITEYEARHRFEKKCPKIEGWAPEWHGPHEWHHPHNTGQTLSCYGLGSTREVPELPQHYYTPEIQEEH